MQIDTKISCKPFPGLSLKTFPLLILFLSWSAPVALAQFHEDFSDTDLSSSPQWSGTTGDFVVNALSELQLNAEVAGKSWISTRLDLLASQEIEWHFRIKQTFAPSGSNFGRIYLISDQSDLSSPLNGYFLQFGEAGATDAVELFRQSGTNTISICKGTAGAIAAAFNATVKVRYRPGGLWELFADYAGDGDLLPEASATHLNDFEGKYFGLLCTYTISNATRFYFDDMEVRITDLPDTLPPFVINVDVSGANSLSVNFSEALMKASVTEQCFSADPAPGKPSAVSLNPAADKVSLFFPEAFPNGKMLALQVRNVKDSSGNQIKGEEIKFIYFEERPVSAKDVVINEILADPSPAIGLPESEFVELYNRSKDPVNLEGWIIADPARAGVLPFFILHPGAYVVVVSTSDVEDFQRVGDVVGLTRFPSLNDGGDKLTITDDGGQVIDSLTYSSAWFRSEEKAAGGWSLERIDPNDVCGEANNWKAAESPEGGTPGHRNSVFANRPDNRGPVIKSVVATDSMTIEVVFDEKLDEGSVSPDEFDLGGQPDVLTVKVSGASVTLSLSTPLISGRVYMLQVGNVLDCPGNRMNPADATATLILPGRAEPGDIIINELLFNPRPTGVDFFEIYNRSDKVINLQHWSARNASAGSGAFFPLTRLHHLIYPGQFVAFTRDANVLKGEYVAGVESAFMETEVPPMNDNEGSLALFDKQGQMIDSAYYRDSMHSPFLKDDEGVSLERISAVLPGIASSNWRSASSTAGYATPGYSNSNNRGDVASGFEVVVEPEIVRPYVTDHDFARIRYQFRHNGLIANVRVVDHQGRAIRTIADNELIGTKGDFRWDGDTDDGRVAGTGYYMVWFEVFGAEGDVKTYRKRVVVF